ncbi:uncharacterized protein K460DRAFT_401661 [Cucurbitaria berberidis CBS 394.84]|uniref:Uncharacterized protein n=1 Tax=Cucurbitaria berberidis CBS 394.84 TaxID=1168544 RepID=A0A9P4LDA4_9PLEO|nr:uncharacterized protein K460DRAFT_401661 [Cucurbitaria berberidis CBS 394.84]KAF1851646.1 hypothetical protein K460DRAFT_401661 [Cucurbitaria berberidis CBS 394.84]
MAEFAPDLTTMIDRQLTFYKVDERCLGYNGGCVSVFVTALGNDLCGICRKRDLHELKDLFSTTEAGKEALKGVVNYRRQRHREALGQGLVVCALENLRWEGKLRGFVPISPCPCVFVDTPGGDDGMFCWNCAVHENISGRSLWFVLPADEGHTDARFNFPCIWVDESFQNHPFRLQFAQSMGPCNWDETKYAASMCRTCRLKVNNMVDYSSIMAYFWDDGRLKEVYRGEASIPTVRRSPPLTISG